MIDGKNSRVSARIDVHGSTVHELRANAEAKLAALMDGVIWQYDMTIVPSGETASGEIIDWEAEVSARVVGTAR